MRQMKDSGVEWIGQIPEGWKIQRLKTVCTVRGEKNKPDAEVLSVYRELGVVKKSERTDNHNITSDDTSNYKYVLPNDLVVNKMKAWQGSMGVSKYEGIVSPAYYVFRITSDKVYPFYLHYLLRDASYLPEYRRLSGGIRPGQWDLSVDSFQNIPILIPKKEEQRRIASYLDHKCSQIDAIIARQQEVIEKLKAYKLSLITEAVTKGLDPNVPMKDSGVEWIGKIPQFATVTCVRHLYKIILGKMLSPTQKDEDDTLESYFCAANVHFTDIDYKNLKTMWFSNGEKSDYLVRYGDLLVVEGGAGAGGAHIVEKPVGKCYIQNSIMIARSKSEVSNKWLYYTLYSLVKREYIDFVCNKATIPHLTKDKLGNTPVVLFPKEIEETIIVYLDKKCRNIDRLILQKENLIEQLTTYKKSLIYEIVTGKTTI